MTISGHPLERPVSPSFRPLTFSGDRAQNWVRSGRSANRA